MEEETDHSDDGSSSDDDVHMASTTTSEDGSEEPDFVCEVCGGFGEKGHPRGVFVPTSELEETQIQTQTPRERAFTYFYLHYPNLRLLSASSEDGCQVCELILGSIRKHIVAEHGAEAWDDLVLEEEMERDEFDHEEDSADIAASTELARREGALRVPNMDAYYGAGRVALYAFYETDHKGPRETAGPQRVFPEILGGDVVGSVRPLDFLVSPADPLDPDFSHRPSAEVLSQPHVDLVRRWREECANSHPACQSIELDQRLPTRVLEIPSSSTTDEIDSCKVIETCGRKGVYAALSYCWGTTPQLEKTTTQNLARHLDHIPLTALPNTITDAIRLCHKLGFRYIWVDALCIVQDDRADWAREAATMCDVYGNAALTLVTSLVGDSSESFLEARREGALSPEPAAAIPFTDPESGLPGSLWLYDDLFADGAWVLENDWADISSRARDPSAWLGRAWCFQEWILSPRLLHVHEQTLWDCFGGYASEVSGRHVGPTPLRRSLRARGGPPGAAGSPGDAGRRAVTATWAEIVAEFTARAITRESDRLPALAGLAAAYARATGRGTYLAGLWLEDLPAELLWRRAGEVRGDEPGGAAHGAPSFSWVSLRAPVSFPDLYLTYRGNFDIKCAVVSFQDKNDDNDDDGPNTPYTSTRRDATIDLEASLARVSNPSSMPQGTAEYNRWSASLDRHEETSLGLEKEDVGAGEVYLLLVVGGHHFFGYYEWLALILKKEEDDGAENGQGGEEFRRLGVATLRVGQYDRENPPAMPMATQECGGSWERRRVRLR